MDALTQELSAKIDGVVAQRIPPADQSAIERAIDAMPAVLRKAAFDARRREIRSFVEQYDRAFSLPRALLGRWISRDDVRLICSMEHEVICGALLAAIRHQLSLKKKRYAPAAGELIALRRVYVAERYYALQARRALGFGRAA